MPTLVYTLLAAAALCGVGYDHLLACGTRQGGSSGHAAWWYLAAFGVLVAGLALVVYAVRAGR